MMHKARISYNRLNNNPLLDICTNKIVIIIVSSTLIAYCTYEKMISSLFVKRWKESLPSYYLKDHDSLPHVNNLWFVPKFHLNKLFRSQ